MTDPPTNQSSKPTHKYWPSDAERKPKGTNNLSQICERFEWPLFAVHGQRRLARHSLLHLQPDLDQAADSALGPLHFDQSISLARVVAGDFGFFTFTQYGDRPAQ
jgi:hypothetical protein